MAETGIERTSVARKKEKRKKIAIIGPTNSGKSLIFNRFTKSYSEVANYPQTTVYSIHKESTIGDRSYEVWDTPGISSLNISSDDERVTRDILLIEKPDIILFTGDSTRLKRSLVLLSQVLELGIPTVFVLNKADEASRKGIVINTGELSRRLEIPVVETAVAHEIGFDRIEEAINNGRAHDGLVKYPRAIEEAINNIRNSFTDGTKPSKGLALLLLSGDDPVAEMLAKGEKESSLKAKEAVQTFFRKTPSSNAKQVMFNTREGWADRLTEQITATASFTVPGFAQKAAALSRHPLLGWPIVFTIMWVTFYGVGTIAAKMATVLDTWLFIPLTTFIGGMITYPIVNEFLVGHFGILTMGVMNAIDTVVPILIVFFLIVNFLEDVGYLPNLSVLLNRLFSYFGLTGKSVLTISLGFGCNAMATLTSRMLETKKERIVASSLIALGIPCAVQLGVMIAILATAPFSALVIVVTTVLATQIVFGVALNKLLKTDKAAEFIMELPTFKWPNWKNIVRKTYFRIKNFLEEALPLFILGAALMFALDKTGLLGILKTAARPVVTGILSLPDKATEVFILVISRRELGAMYFKDMVDAMEVDYYQIVVGLTVMTLFIPCISNTMVMIKELGLRWAVWINASIIVIAITVGGVLNFALRLF